MLTDQALNEWKELNATVKALINLIDPDRIKIRVSILTIGLIMLEHKKSNSTIRITSTKNAINDVTHFINNDPTDIITQEMPLNENMVSHKY